MAVSDASLLPARGRTLGTACAAKEEAMVCWAMSWAIVTGPVWDVLNHNSSFH